MSAFYQFRKSLQIISIQNNSIYVKTWLSIIIGGTQIITNKRKNTPYFEQMVGQIYPTELQLNKANSSDTGLELVNNKWHSFF